MRSLLALSGSALCAAMLAACMTDAPPPNHDAPSPAASADPIADPAATETAVAPRSDDPFGADPFAITPKACFIEAFCQSAAAGGLMAFCIHTGPCPGGQGLQLAITFCNNRCPHPGTNCNNIVELPPCP